MTLFLMLKQTKIKERRSFRSFDAWLNHSEFKKLVKKEWMKLMHESIHKGLDMTS